MTDDFKKTRTNTTELYRAYSEREIKNLLTMDLIEKADLRPGHSRVSVVIKNANKQSIGPAVYEAEVRITIDHDVTTEPP